jgi:hypothetical protein
MWSKAELVSLILRRERELIALILERERRTNTPEPEPEPEPVEFDGPKPHPMIEVTQKIRARKLQQFFAAVKRRPPSC